ncbi:MAG TPA: universal stress protein [Amycolatopsis sp.]|uniref:universal stress protein n=1 Tax=Amycolatopsis sp. TaxID=37632 RepID=UPI002B495189|nr:universal stress protein [Amycolatopsis sp.]HKS48524.1 universal stress protein [Amycolatopsis sp.]
MTGVEGAIVVGVDGSEESERAVRWAATEAGLRKAHLHLVHGFAPQLEYEGTGLAMPQEVIASLVHAARDILDQRAATARQVAGDVPVTTETAQNLPVPLLLELSRRARMIVLGSSGSGGFTGMRIGSTASAVAAHARCPVVVVRGTAGEGPVVVGVDGSPVSERAIAAAFDEASWRQAPLVAVHAFVDVEYISGWHATEEEERAVLAESLAGWREKYPDVGVERIAVLDRPRHQLLDWSQRAQLVVVGSRGRGGLPGLLLGSTSQALIQHAHCPVMVVRP